MDDLERFKKFVRENNPFVPDLLQEFELVRKIDSVEDITDSDWLKLMVEYEAAGITWKIQVLEQEIEDALGDEEHDCYVHNYQAVGQVGVIVDGVQELLGSERECELYLKGFLRALELKKEC